MLEHIKSTVLGILTDKEKFHAFVGGDIVSSIFATIMVVDLNQHPLLKLLFIVVGGLVGGFFAPFGKDIYTWIKKKVLR